MTQKHSPLPFKCDDVIIYDKNNHHVVEVLGIGCSVEEDLAYAAYIIRACNNFEEMRGLLHRLITETKIDRMETEAETIRLLTRIGGR